MNDIHNMSLSRLSASIQAHTFAWAALVALAITAIFLHPIDNLDIWWHLDSGRWMLAHHRYLGEEVRSFSLNGAQWNNFSWLFQVTVALLERWGGMWALLLFKAALLWALLTLLFLSIGTRGAPLGWLLAFTLFSWQIILHVTLRPHLVEGLFLAVVIYWLQQQPSRRDVWKYALLILVWANVHASVVIGVTALAVHYLVGPHFCWPSSSEIRKRLPGVLLLVMLPVVTPNGFDLVDVLMRHAHSAYLHTYIREWLPLDRWPAALWPVIVALLCASFLKMRILRPAEIFLIGFFLVYSFSGRRFLFELALVLMRPTGVLLGAVLSRAGENFPRLAGPNGWLLGGILLGGGALLFRLPVPWGVSYGQDYPVAERLFPHVAMSVLAPVAKGEQELRVWNAYGWGGYIGWRGNGRVKVFVDGRTPTVFPEQMLVIDNLSYGRANLLRHMAKVWGVGAILIHRRRSLPFSVNDPVWRVAAFDSGSVLYLRADLAQKYNIEPIGFEPFQPIGRVAMGQLPHYIRQLRKLLAKDAHNSLAWLHLGEFLGQAWMIRPSEEGASQIRVAISRAIAEEPEQLLPRVRMAMWLRYMGRPSREIVRPLLPQIWKVPPEERSMYAVPLAKLLVTNGYPREALRVLSYDSPQIQHRLDHFFPVWLLRLEAYLDLGDETEATRINEIASAMSFDASPRLVAQYRALLAEYPALASNRRQ